MFSLKKKKKKCPLSLFEQTDDVCLGPKNDLKFSPVLNITQKISKGTFLCHFPFAKLSINETLGIKDTNQHLSVLTAFFFFPFLLFIFTVLQVFKFSFSNSCISVFIAFLYVMGN